MRWKCNNCEHLNDENTSLCEVCDSQSVELVEFTSREISIDSQPFSCISWKVSHAEKIEINNGVGVVESEGECKIRLKNTTTTIELKAKNRYSERIFKLEIILPSPTIEYFKCNSDSIEIGKPVSFSWKVNYAENVYLDEEDVTGFITSSRVFEESKTVSLIVKNANGEASSSLEVAVAVPGVKKWIKSIGNLTIGLILILFVVFMFFLMDTPENEPNSSRNELKKLKQHIVCLKENTSSGDNDLNARKVVIREIEIVELLIDGFGEKTTSENLEYASDKVHNLEKKLEQFGVSTEGCIW